MSLSVFYYCICPCLCRCRSFNPSLCRLLPFRPSYVAVSRPRRLSKFTLTGPHRKPITPWTCARSQRAQMTQQIVRSKD